MPEPFNDPAVVAYMLLMPVVIIGLAKMWKRVKDKKAEKLAAAAPQTNAENN
ncbi:MAG TPA: hypothetical protein V6C76_07285 [Drouetiella sp.]